MSTEFDERYYNCNNYVGYLSRQERYERMAQEIHHDLFRRLCLNYKHVPVIDYGCSVGFIVKAFNDLGYYEITGYDVSKWAIEYGNDHVLDESRASITNHIPTFGDRDC